MGLLGNLFGKDYADQYFDVGLSDPETGENLFLVPYADGTGADLKTESDPLIQGWGEPEDLATFVEQTNANLQGQLQEMGLDLLRYSAEFRGQNPAVSNIMNSGRVDVANPDALSVAGIDEAAEVIGREAFNTQSNGDPELQAVMNDISQGAAEIRQNLNEILEGRDFSIINAGNEALKDMGFSEAEIKQAMTPPENVNAPQAGQDYTVEQPQFP